MKNILILAVTCITLAIGYKVLKPESKMEDVKQAQLEQAEREEMMANVPQEQPGYGEISQETNAEIPEDKPTWTFRGQIMDLLREEPIEGATITFQNDFIRGAGVYKTKSDFGGSYEIEVPSLGENAYNARVEHPDYMTQTHWTEDVLQKTKEERYLLGTGYLQFGAVSGTYRSEDNFSTDLNLYIFPVKLTEEEKKESAEAFRKNRGSQ